MNQICRNLLSNSNTFMLSKFFSDNSIANVSVSIHIFQFFAFQSGISRRKILCGRCPHPASGIRLDFSGNTANADGIRLEHPLDKVWCSGFFFLQVLGKPFPIKDDQLV